MLSHILYKKIVRHCMIDVHNTIFMRYHNKCNTTLLFACIVDTFKIHIEARAQATYKMWDMKDSKQLICHHLHSEIRVKTQA